MYLRSRTDIFASNKIKNSYENLEVLHYDNVYGLHPLYSKRTVRDVRRRKQS